MAKKQLHAEMPLAAASPVRDAGIPRPLRAPRFDPRPVGTAAAAILVSSVDFLKSGNKLDALEEDPD